MKNYKFWVILFPVLLALVSACSHQPTGKGNGQLTENILKNTTYHIGELGTIRLNNGVFKRQYGEDATQMHQVNLEKIAFGDLNGDGVNDAAVILAWQNGGIGTFKYLVALQNSSGLPQQIDSILLGDRVQIDGLPIASGAVALEMVTHAPKDPMCCPSQQIKQTFILRANKWTQSNGKIVHPIVAKETTEMLDPDITGVIWTLESFNDKLDLHTIIIDSPDNYTFTLFPSGAFQVKADCNRMQGQFTLEGKQIKLSPGPATLAECPPGSSYSVYLRHLSKIDSFILRDNKLELNLMRDEGKMVFRNSGSIRDNGHH